MELLPGETLRRVTDQSAVAATVRDDSLDGVVVGENTTTAVRFAFDLEDGEAVGFGSPR